MRPSLWGRDAVGCSVIVCEPWWAVAAPMAFLFSRLRQVAGEAAVTDAGLE